MAPGQTKAAKAAATPAKGSSAAARANVAANAAARTTGKPAVTPQQEPNLGRSAEAHHHVIICHRTGSDSNPYVVINIPMTAWTEAHSPETGSHPTLNERDDIQLEAGPVPPGGKMGHTKAECGQVAGVQIVPKVEEQAPSAVQVVAETKQQGGVLGAQAVVKQPKAKPQARGGVLGEIAAVPSSELPFTGIQLWIVLLAGIGLLAAGVGARKAMR